MSGALVSIVGRPFTFWVVRCAECENDVDVDSSWHRRSDLRSDNSPLTARGREQANELGKRFENERFDHVFVSPFDRCVETASRIIGKRNIPIKVEHGFTESLHYCDNPPGFESTGTLKGKYRLVDTTYEPIMVAETIREKKGGDRSCISRVSATLQSIFKKYPGSTVLIVTHRAPIGAVHEYLTGEWVYVGQATVSKFVQFGISSNDFHFRQELSNDDSHLSDKSNLRRY